MNEELGEIKKVGYREAFEGSNVTLRYGLDGPEIESRWGRNFPHPPIPAVRPTQPPVNWVLRLFSAGKYSGRGVDKPPYLEPRLQKECNYTSNPLYGPWLPLLGFNLPFNLGTRTEILTTFLSPPTSRQSWLLRVTTFVPPFTATFVINSPYKPHNGRERV